MKHKSYGMKSKFIKSNFLIYFGTFMLPVLLLEIFFLSDIYMSERRKIEKELDNSMSLASDLVSVYDTDTNAFQLYVKSCGSMAQYIRVFKRETLDYDSANAIRFLSAYMTALHNSRTDMESVYFYLNNDLKRLTTSERLIENVADMEDSNWVDILADMQGDEWNAVVRPYGKAEDVFSIFYRFRNYKGGTVINYDLAQQREKLEQMIIYDRQFLMVFDVEGKFIFSNEERVPREIVEMVQEELPSCEPDRVLKNNGYLIKVNRNNGGHFIVATAVPQRTVNNVFWSNMTIFIWLLGVIMVASAVLAYDRANRNYRQLYRIIDVFDYAEKNLELDPEIGKDDTIYDQILQNIIRMFLRNSYLQLQLSERKYREMTAQLLALQYQINPHFLFNTLQALNYEVLEISGGKWGNANYMVENLSDMLRYSLDTREMDVSIRKEIEICQKYLDIQKLRTGQDFIVEWEVDPDVEKQKIRRMLLQPLLENAFSHGIKGIEKGKIRIIVQKQNDKICFKVLDNGNGISSERLKEIRGKLKESVVEFESEHIGLQNVNARLLLAYGEAAELHINSKVGMGTIQYFYIHYEEGYDEC